MKFQIIDVYYDDEDIILFGRTDYYNEFNKNLNFVKVKVENFKPYYYVENNGIIIPEENYKYISIGENDIKYNNCLYKIKEVKLKPFDYYRKDKNKFYKLIFNSLKDYKKSLKNTIKNKDKNIEKIKIKYKEKDYDKSDDYNTVYIDNETEL